MPNRRLTSLKTHSSLISSDFNFWCLLNSSFLWPAVSLGGLTGWGIFRSQPQYWHVIDNKFSLTWDNVVLVFVCLSFCAIRHEWVKTGKSVSPLKLQWIYASLIHSFMLGWTHWPSGMFSTFAHYSLGFKSNSEHKGMGFSWAYVVLQRWKSFDVSYQMSKKKKDRKRATLRHSGL